MPVKLKKINTIWGAILLSQIPIIFALSRPSYYIFSLAALTVLLVVLKPKFDNLAKTLCLIYLLSNLGLVNYLLFMDEYQVKYTDIQVLVFYLSASINYILFSLTILIVKDYVKDLEEDRVAIFFSCTILIVALSRCVNIFLFNDVQGDDGRYFLGFYLPLFLPISAYVAIKYKSFSSLLASIALLLVFFGCFSLYLHRSIVLLIPFILMLWVVGKLNVKKIIIVMVISFISIFLFLSYFDGLSDKYFYRMRFIAELSFSDGSSLDRIARYLEIFKLMFDNILTSLFGFSFGSSESLTKTVASHSAFLGFYMDVGLVAFILYLYFVIYRAYKLKPTSEFRVLIKSTLLTLLVYSTFYYAPAFPVAEVKIIDFMTLSSVLIGMCLGFCERDKKQALFS